MYYTVRLNKDKDDDKDVKLYTFQGTSGVCLGDFITQGNEIRSFLENVVIPGIFQNGFKSWKWKSIKKAQFHDDEFSRAFVADIEIAVEKK
jgi:hypothetical protein